MKFTFKAKDSLPTTGQEWKYVMEFDESNLYEVSRNFMFFLKGCGFFPPGDEIEFVKEDDDEQKS